MADYGVLDISYSTVTFQQSGTQYGQTITAGAADAKGSWVVIGTPTYPLHAMTIVIASAGSAANYLMDVAIGTTGGEQVIIPDLLFSSPRAGQSARMYFMPIGCIATNTQVSVRVQSNVAAATLSGVQIYPHATGWPGWPRLCRPMVIGTRSTGGAAIDPGGSANTKGAWTVLGTPTYPLRAGELIVGQKANTAMTTAIWRIDVGLGSPATVVAGDLLMTANTTSDDVMPVRFPLNLHVSSNTAVSVRAQCTITDATDRLFDAQLVGWC